MPDLDTFYAGGATGALSRATQLVNQAVANAAAKAASMAKAAAPPRPAPTPGLLPPVSNTAPAVGLPTTHFNDVGVLGPTLGTVPYLKDAGFADKREQGVGLGPAGDPIPQKTDADKQQEGTYRAYLHDEGAGKLTSGTKASNSTIKQMLDDVDHDPLASPDKKQAARDLADSFRDQSHFRLFTKDELVDNPVLRTLNDLSVWSQFRQKVADWNAQKKKTGDTTAQDAGDGTVTGLVENGSFSSVTSPAALSPYMVVRNEDGMLDVVSVDQWIQGKFTDMHKDPKYAAQMITALALTSMYGSDSSANSQASRVALDRQGNPVKAIVSNEDLSALKQFANQAVIFQNQGEEVAADDVLSQVVQLGTQVSAQNGANGEHGGSGGGGFGGGGGGGGGAGAVRYTDAAELSSQLDSIARTRLGQSLTAEQHQQFVDYFHALEAQNSAAYMAGQSFTTLDPQSQAVQWVEQHFGQQAGGYTEANLAARFMQMMGGSNPFGGLS